MISVLMVEDGIWYGNIHILKLLETLLCSGTVISINHVLISMVDQMDGVTYRGRLDSIHKRHLL